MNPATLTHCVTRTLDFPECQGLLDSGVAIVLPSWVTRSVEMERLQLPRHYSPDTALFLAGLVVCTSGMPSYDAACIECGVESLGGQYRRELTREVTHLIVLAPHGVRTRPVYWPRLTPPPRTSTTMRSSTGPSWEW